MKQKMQTGLFAFLMLLAFSCTKESSNTSSKPAINSSQDQMLADNTDAKTAIPGIWTFHYSWGCTGSYSTTSITFNANGTFTTAQSEGGQWTSSKKLLMFHYDNISGYNTCYSGIRDGATATITGIQSSFQGTTQTTGCFYLTKPEPKDKDVRVKGMPDASGKN